jgi:thiol-disulfide isomerase/thioredoxin
MSGRRLILAVLAIAACARSSPSPPASPAGEQVALARTRPLEPPLGHGATSPNLVATPDGALLTWLEPIAATPSAHRLRFARFSRGAWTPAATITQGPNVIANWADVPSIARQEDGTLVAHWAEKSALPGAHGDDAHGYDVVIARSVDGGATWRRLGAPHRDGTDTEHGFVSLVADGDAVIAFWLDGRAMANGQTDETALRSARIRDTIGEEQLIDDRVCDCCSTSATATPAGPVVTYRDRSLDELRDPWVARRPGEAWSAPRPVHADGWRIAGCPVNGPKIVAMERELALAWYTRAGERPGVRIAFSSDAGLSFDRPIEIDAASGDLAPLGHVDVVIDHPGEAIVSWVAAKKDTAHLRVRRVARDRRRGAALELATIPAARDSGLPRMVRVEHDLVFAWTDPRAATVRTSLLPLAQVPPVTTTARQAPEPARVSFPIGSRAPAYEATTLDGAGVSLAKLPKAPILVNVWATWCESCRHELPVLAALQQRYAAQGLQVATISVDRELPPNRIAEIVSGLGGELEIWHDPEDRASSVFGVTTLPTTLLFDTAGTLIWRHEGAIVAGDTAVDRAIQQALAR